MNKTVNVLQITVGGNAFTGVASFLLQYYRGIDRSKVHFDFLFCKQNSMELVMDDPVFEGSRFYVLNATQKNSNEMDYLALARKLSAVLKKGHYDVVHINTTAVGVTLFSMLVARLCGVKTVISHSHNTKVTVKKGARRRNRILQKAINGIKEICPWMIRTMSDALFACSEEAGITLFGRKGVTGRKFRVIRNAIDAGKYRVSPEIRRAVRAEQNVDETVPVFGHIGRLSPEKNHTFLIDVFSHIQQELPEAQLWIIGGGAEEENILRKIGEHGLEGSVKLLGQKNDIHRWLQAMDVFLFPSITEGLGMVAIEAQAAALPTYASDAVPQDTNITDRIRYLPLASGPECWAELILSERMWTEKRPDTYEDLVKSGFDMKESALRLQEFYIACTGKG